MTKDETFDKERNGVAFYRDYAADADWKLGGQQHISGKLLYDEEKIMRTRENRIRREAQKKEKEKGIWMLVSTLRDLNISDDVILQKIQEKFSFS